MSSYILILDCLLAVGDFSYSGVVIRPRTRISYLERLLSIYKMTIKLLTKSAIYATMEG